MTRFVPVITGFLVIVLTVGTAGGACLTILSESGQTVFERSVGDGSIVQLDFINSMYRVPVRETYIYRQSEGLFIVKVESPSAAVFEYYRLEHGPDMSVKLDRFVGTMRLKSHDYSGHVLTIDGKAVHLKDLAASGDVLSVDVKEDACTSGRLP